MNVLSQNKQQEIEILLSSGQYSQRKIAKLLKIDRETVRRYAQQRVDLATQPGVSTGAEIKPSHPCPPAAQASACQEHADWIAEQVRLGRNAMAIYQDLVDTRGFAHRYASVKRFVGRIRKTEPEIFDILAFAPGEEAQVDYGQGALTLHPRTEKYRRPRLFVMTLRYSRRSFRKVVWNSSAETWAQLHEEAFRYFGGTPKFVVLDNLREGVVKPDLYDPEINGIYAACLAHYGTVADPCRVRDPNRKGTVENAIQHTQDTALKGRKFESLDEQNEHLLRWEDKWAAPRIHGSTKRQVCAMFEEEKPFLNLLPLDAFKMFKEEKRTVDDAATVTVDKARYSARPARPYTRVLVRIYEREIEIYEASTHELLRRHSRARIPGAVVIEEKDRIFNPSRNTAYGLARAKEIGPRTLQLCESIFANEGRIGNKSIFAVISLAEKHGNSLVERASEIALGREKPQYREVKRVVVNLSIAAKDMQKTDNKELVQESALIRTGQEYGWFWKRHAASTGETPCR